MPPRGLFRQFAGSRRWALLLAAAAALFLPGCPSGERAGELATELQACRERADQLEQQNDQLARRVEALAAQVAQLEQIGDKRPEALARLADIRLSDRSTAVETDPNRIGADLVRLYLEPIDVDGHVVKTPGEVTVRLFDLAGDPNAPLLGRCRYDADQLRRQWRSGFLSYHYTLECPLDRPATGETLTARVAFTEYLTGRTLTAQRDIAVAPGDD